MSKVLGFMKQVARGLQVEGNFGTAHVYRSSLNAIIAYRGKDDFAFNEVTSEWLKGFEVYLRGRGCSWIPFRYRAAGHQLPDAYAESVQWVLDHPAVSYWYGSISS